MTLPLVKLFSVCNPKQWPTISSASLTKTGYPVFGANGHIGYYSQYNHAEPTILITCRGATCGTVNVSDPKSYVTGNAMALDDLDATTVHQRYLYHALVYRGFRDAITGTAQPQITRQSLEAVTFPLPPVPEQKRIAAILDKADAIRRKRQQAIELTENLLRSAFLEMFGDPVTNPKGWARESLGAHLSGIDAGWSVGGEPRLPTEGEDAVLKISAVTSGRFRADECKAVERHGREVPRPRRGDLLMSRANTRELVAATCLVEEDAPRRFLPDKIWRIRLQPSLCVEYLRYLLWNPLVRENLTQHATGTSGSMLNVSQAKLAELAVPKPPTELQRAFGSLVWKAYDARAELERAWSGSEALAECVTSNAFSGKL